MTIACPDCGSAQELPVPAHPAVVSCRSCGGTFERTSGRSITAAFALALSVFALLIPSNVLPFLAVGVAGRTQQTRLGSAVPLLFDMEWVLLAIGIAAFAVVLPLVRFGLLTATLGALRFGFRRHWVGRGFRWATALDLWAMPDVFLVACLVGYTRLTQHLTVHIGPGGWCFLVAAPLSMVARASLDRRAVWRAIEPDRAMPAHGPVISCTTCDQLAPASAEGTPCPRCGERLHARKPDAMVRTAALVLAGLILYVPANVYPMTIVERLGDTEGHIILYGVTRLVDAGLWPFAIIIFTASIAIPLLKLVGLSWFLLSIRFRWRWALVARTKLHRAIDSVGHWSNLDVFIIAVFAPLMQFGWLVDVEVGIGAPAFFGVVVLTMLASRWFDPRLMWDAVEARR